jgi:hypothetical protein
MTIRGLVTRFNLFSNHEEHEDNEEIASCPSWQKKVLYSFGGPLNPEIISYS